MKATLPRILVIRRRYLGDIVLLGSLFRNLRLHWPGARLAALIEPVYHGVLAMNPDVDEVFAFPPRTRDWPRIVAQLRQSRFTHVLDLDNREKTAVLARLTGAPIRITVRLGERLLLPAMYTQAERVPGGFLDGRHITDFYLHFLDLIDVPIVTRECRLAPRAEDLATVRELLASFGAGTSGRRILVHPGSRSAWRVWPPQNFAAVIDRLQEKHNASAFIIAGPGEQETVEAICRHARHPVHRIRQPLTVPQLAALFASFDLMLCHD
ncbi:MAG TPA: glycosyltransferase family 9 protein, partial [Candidatus Didemnitutus sp.]|nr:glycosyltransferase family 9 protein [Candidatus Didemnitutus sp.]